MTDISDAYEASYTIMLNFEPQLDNQTGGFLCRKSYYLTGFYHLVFENLSGWKVLYIPARH